MDHLRRLAYFALGLMLGAVFVLPGFARAETIPATPASSYAPTITKVWSGFPDGVTGRFAAARCSANLAAYQTMQGLSPTNPSRIVAVKTGWELDATAFAAGVSAACNWMLYNGTSGAYGGITVSQTTTCPSGGALSGGMCVTGDPCPTSGGWTLDPGGATCSRPDCLPAQSRDAAGACTCPTGSITVASGYIAGKSSTNTAPASACFGGCTVAAREVTFARAPGATQYEMVLSGPFAATGAQCTGSAIGGGAPADPVPSPESKCIDRGQSYGYVNGAVVCVAKQSPGAATVEAKSNADKVVTKDASGNTTGTTETTLEQRCEGGACTTVEVKITRDGAGNITGKTETTKPGDGSELGKFCEQNPNSPICKPSAENSWSGGDCLAGIAPTCDGDPVLCAVAKQQFFDSCKFNARNSPDGLGEIGAASSWWEANKEGKGFNVNGTGGIRATGTLPTINTDARQFGGRTLADYSVDVLGHSITIPFSRLVDVLGYMGLALQAVALIIAARIFHQGVM